MRFPMIFLALAGCAAVQPFGDREQNALSQELAGREAGGAQRCVSTTGNRSLRFVDDNTIAYGSGRTVWINRLDSPCPGSDSLDTVIAEIHGSQYCNGDRVRRLDRGSSIPGRFCRLGDFIPYTKP